MNSYIAYIGLGSNLEDPFWQLQRAIKAIATLSASWLLKVSKAYQTVAFGPIPQPDYINACLSIETKLNPFELLEHLQKIEIACGRVRFERWGPRTLDLDLLLYGGLVLDTPELCLPHVGMHERNTVLQPLMDIAPSITLPDGRSIATLLATVGLAGLTPLARCLYEHEN